MRPCCVRLLYLRITSKDNDLKDLRGRRSRPQVSAGLGTFRAPVSGENGQGSVTDRPAPSLPSLPSLPREGTEHRQHPPLRVDVHRVGSVVRDPEGGILSGGLKSKGLILGFRDLGFRAVCGDVPAC